MESMVTRYSVTILSGSKNPHSAAVMSDVTNVILSSRFTRNNLDMCGKAVYSAPDKMSCPMGAALKDVTKHGTCSRDHSQAES